MNSSSGTQGKVVLLDMPLSIVMATRDPQGTSHLVAFILTLGAKPLNGTAILLNSLLSRLSH